MKKYFYNFGTIARKMFFEVHYGFVSFFPDVFCILVVVGHSLSFGRADAVCILSPSAALADAAATAVGNLVHEKKDIERGLEKGKEIPGVLGTLIIVGDTTGAWGNMRLTQL